MLTPIIHSTNINYMKLGLCCISEVLKSNGVKFQTMTRSRALKLGDDYIKILQDRINNNLDVIDQIIDHCASSGISHYRISSSMFPLIGEPQLGLGVDFLVDMGVPAKLRKIGDKIKSHGITVSTHPSQYVVLASKTPTTVENSIFDLELHGWLHDNLGLPQDYSNPINIHVGISSYEPDEIYNNFMSAFNKLSLSVQKRLVLENDDKGFWNAENLYDYFSNQFPLTFDNLHFECNPSSGTMVYWFSKYSNIWFQQGFTPIFHWSEGGAKGKPRSHVDYFTSIPEIVSENTDVIWECEVKSKDLAISKVLLDL